MLPEERKTSQSSRALDSTDAAVVKLLMELGFQHKRIAALFDVNQGRIAEIGTGQRHSQVESLRAYWRRGRWDAGVKDTIE